MDSWEVWVFCNSCLDTLWGAVDVVCIGIVAVGGLRLVVCVINSVVLLMLPIISAMHVYVGVVLCILDLWLIWTRFVDLIR